MPHNIRFSDQARLDLQALTDWITTEAGSQIAHAYVELIRARCEGLAKFPRQGRLRRRAPAVRSIAFKRNATILYVVNRKEILILRVLHNGRDTERDIAALE